MSKTFLINAKDRPDITADDSKKKWYFPGAGDVPALLKRKVQGSSRYLGRQETPYGEGPWVYLNEFAKGSVIPLHRHAANRIEFLISGAIEWREPGNPPVVYEAGTLSYVEAGTPYGYTVLEDARILLCFDGPPGVTQNL